MSDDQRPARPAQHEEAGDEVEGHKHHFAGNDEPRSDEKESDDEVEAHSHHRLAKHKLQ
jgi:hypothetical protein